MASTKLVAPKPSRLVREARRRRVCKPSPVQPDHALACVASHPRPDHLDPTISDHLDPTISDHLDPTI
jgi:hypothetical protein